MINQDYPITLSQQLHILEVEHRRLNKMIDAPETLQKLSEFTISQIKKKKLLLKDKIRKLKSALYPDIIA